MPSLRRDLEFLERLKRELVKTLQANGIRASVETKRVPTTSLYRVRVVAPKFRHMAHSERQSLVWRIAEKALSPAEQFRISMILTLAGNSRAKNSAESSVA